MDERRAVRSGRHVVSPEFAFTSVEDREIQTTRVAPDGTVRLRLAFGGVLEIATCPQLNLERRSGPRRAFLSPQTGRRGPFVAIVEGVPAAVADLFFSHVRDQLEQVAAAPASSLNRAVRVGCEAVRSAARGRPDLDAFGFTAVLFESAPETVAFVAQLPPCQLYLVDGSRVRPLPEVPTGQSVGRGRSVSDRRWEVEIEALRVPLVHDSRIVLVDASVPEFLTDPARLIGRVHRQVGAMASSLQALMNGREAVVIRFARPVASTTRIALASERARSFVRAAFDPATLLTRLSGHTADEGDNLALGPQAVTNDPETLAALLELEATGRVPDLPSRALARGSGRSIRGSSGSLGRETKGAEDTSPRDGRVPVAPGPAKGDWTAGRTRFGSGAALGSSQQPGEPPFSRDAFEPRERAGLRRRASAFGALVGPSVPVREPWLGSARGPLVPTTFSGIPLESARYPRASDPRRWMSRMLGPTVFLPGPRRRGQPTWVSGSTRAVIATVAIGFVWATFQPEAVVRLADRLAAPTATVTVTVPTPTVPVLVGRTLAAAKGRFTSLAAPPKLATVVASAASRANTIVAVHDDIGEVVTITLGSFAVTREPVAEQSGTAPVSPGFVARGLFAAGGALVARDDGKLLFDAKGSITLLPSSGQPTRLKIKSQKSWATPVGAVVYGSSLYVFDTGVTVSGQQPNAMVWRHPLTSGGNYDADAVNWLAPGQTVDLTLASDVATDGAFWISRRDGTIVKLAAGRAQVLELKGAGLPSRLGAIYTDQNTKSLYVVDEEGTRRLIRIGKDGVIGPYVESVLSQGEAARGLWVDEAEKIAVIATTGRVVVVPLPS